jgi:uncharacterized SAM-binding protein YcdF (DUF218 family)
MPLVWITIILIYSLITKNPNRRKKSIWTILIMVLFFGNEFIANEAMRAWEKEPLPIDSVQNFNTAIVLTGITNTEKESVNDRVFFQKGADRLLHTVQLYKEGRIKKILITGGSGKLIGGVLEAVQLKKVFLFCGVPDSALIIENTARNTIENALYSKKMIDSINLKGPYLLITSAFHMRRAEGCFQKAGIQIISFPVDLYTYDRSFKFNRLFIPSESAFSKWAVLIHEMLGYFIYKLAGYC